MGAVWIGAITEEAVVKFEIIPVGGMSGWIRDFLEFNTGDEKARNEMFSRRSPGIKLTNSEVRKKRSFVS